MFFYSRVTSQSNFRDILKLFKIFNFNYWRPGCFLEDTVCQESFACHLLFFSQWWRLDFTLLSLVVKVSLLNSLWRVLSFPDGVLQLPVSEIFFNQYIVRRVMHPVSNGVENSSILFFFKKGNVYSDNNLQCQSIKVMHLKFESGLLAASVINLSFWKK